MPGLGRRRCPICGATGLVELAREAWHGGTCTRLRCTSCQTALYREVGTRPMTEAAHTAWRLARTLATAKVVRRRR